MESVNFENIDENAVISLRECIFRALGLLVSHARRFLSYLLTVYDRVFPLMSVKTTRLKMSW